MLFVESRPYDEAIAVWFPVMSVKLASLRFAAHLVASVVLVTVLPGFGVDAAHADPYAQSAAPELPDPAYIPSSGGILDDLFGETSGPYAYYAEPEDASAASARSASAASGEADAESGMARGVIDSAFLRAEVDYRTSERPGTLVVDTPNRYLYLVQNDGRAIRYGIGVGRPGFEWSGVKTVSRKSEWPDWTPPPEMLKRRPDLPHHMRGGPDNPLGARALYLGGSMYRIHGTNEPDTIGHNVSSGCIRMMNEDVVDLYSRVHVGTKVVVR
jgi:lipoprotein-anchoring transpeptidase ErfK/SrfK